jgi:hypothetical protein
MIPFSSPRPTPLPPAQSSSQLRSCTMVRLTVTGEGDLVAILKPGPLEARVAQGKVPLAAVGSFKQTARVRVALQIVIDGIPCCNEADSPLPTRSIRPRLQKWCRRR